MALEAGCYRNGIMRITVFGSFIFSQNSIDRLMCAEAAWAQIKSSKITWLNFNSIRMECELNQLSVKFDC